MFSITILITMNNLDQYYSNLKDQTNNQLGLYLFCCSIGVIWTVYVLFFNSRLIGSIATFFLNLYLKRYSKTVWIRISNLNKKLKNYKLHAPLNTQLNLNLTVKDPCLFLSCPARSCSVACIT